MNRNLFPWLFFLINKKKIKTKIKYVSAFDFNYFAANVVDSKTTRRVIKPDSDHNRQEGKGRARTKLFALQPRKHQGRHLLQQVFRRQFDSKHVKVLVPSADVEKDYHPRLFHDVNNANDVRDNSPYGNGRKR